MRHRSLSVLVSLTFLLSALILAACGQGPAATAPTQAPAQATAAPAPTQVPPTAAPTKVPPTVAPTQPPPTEAPKAASAKVVRVAFTQEPNSLSPLYTDMWFSAVVRDLYLATGLIEYNDKNEPIPWIAKEIPSLANQGISADGKTITYKLRENIKWSDGQPLTAEDYVFTWEMIMADGNVVISRDPFDTYVEKVEAPDPQTLVITFTEPYAAWQAKIFSNVNGTQAIPKHVLQPVFEKEGTIDNAEWNRNPTVSFGAFLFKEWESGSHLIFAANPDFFLGAPKVDQVFIKIVPDDSAQVAAIKADDVDIGVFIAYSDMPDLQKLGTLDLVKVVSGYKEGWYFNLSTEEATKGHPALQDVNVRRAIVMAVDRDKICQELLYGLTKPALSVWDGTPYADPKLEPIPYNPEEAKKLLDAAGWKVGGDGIRAKDGVPLKLRYVTTSREVRKNTQVVVQQMLRDVGVDTELIDHSADVFFNSYSDDGPLATGQYDITQWSTVTSFPDPDIVELLCKEIPTDDNPEGTNWAFVCDEELDSLFTQASITLDMQARTEIFFKIAQRVRDQVYWVSIWDDPDWWTVSKKIKNVKLSGATPFWNCYEWELEP
jgi:peptide/nickel transport system substrate-binding protein